MAAAGQRLQIKARQSTTRNVTWDESLINWFGKPSLLRCESTNRTAAQWIANIDHPKQPTFIVTKDSTAPLVRDRSERPPRKLVQHGEPKTELSDPKRERYDKP
uniref:Uncharacterized protein n=1 Tax=Coccidioides posadasii RMSCC 3488 TaxID=454284 RepID=A0A0J6F4K9_COCPO|nr:hypothetical protein CPAG_00552 [Coccidioides posadasii RMSCC 3488]